MIKQTWNIPFSDPECPGALLDAGYNPLLSCVLASRGLNTPEEAQDFTETTKEVLHNPFHIKDMDKAVERIHLAVSRCEKVVVYGDYDVDGITATCLMTLFLRSLGLMCKPYIPDRVTEGYGLNKDAITQFYREGYRLVVTVDCGITAEKEAIYASECGIDLIITDHHECSGTTVPRAQAVIDCKQPEDHYEYKDLCGVGIALKLACAYSGDAEAMLQLYSGLVAIGTIADVMPLTGENRYLVQRGLEQLRNDPGLGLAAILQTAAIDAKNINSSTISYTISPRLNAAGRLGNASLAAELLMTDNINTAKNLSDELFQLNRKRQQIESTIWKEALHRLPRKNRREPIVLESDNWNQGVIGIAASRLAEQFAVPTVMICLAGETGKGSCRSYSNFNMYEALKACSGELISFGGHASAAGLNISKDKISSFRKALSEYYICHKPDSLPDVNCNILLRDASILTEENVKSLSVLEPYGNSNEKTIFCFYDVVMDSISAVANGKHSRLRCTVDGYSFEGIFFSHTPQQCGVKNGDRVDIAFFPQQNNYKGDNSVQLYLTGLRKHSGFELCRNVLLEGYTGFTELLYSYAPAERKDFIPAWRILEKNQFQLPESPEELLRLCPAEMSIEKFCICLWAFFEAGLISSSDGRILGAKKSSLQGKADLFSSPIMTQLSKYTLKKGDD